MYSYEKSLMFACLNQAYDDDPERFDFSFKMLEKKLATYEPHERIKIHKWLWAVAQEHEYLSSTLSHFGKANRYILQLNRLDFRFGGDHYRRMFDEGTMSPNNILAALQYPTYGIKSLEYALVHCTKDARDTIFDIVVQHVDETDMRVLFESMHNNETFLMLYLLYRPHTFSTKRVQMQCDFLRRHRRLDMHRSALTGYVNAYFNIDEPTEDERLLVLTYTLTGGFITQTTPAPLVAECDLIV